MSNKFWNLRVTPQKFKTIILGIHVSIQFIVNIASKELDKGS